jgi:RNA recognition motif-containing protein
LNVKLVTERETGRARVLAFAEMAAAEQDDRAISEMNGSSLDGRLLTVNETNPKGEPSIPSRKGYGGFRQNDRIPQCGRQSCW